MYPYFDNFILDGIVFLVSYFLVIGFLGLFSFAYQLLSGLFRYIVDNLVAFK